MKKLITFLIMMLIAINITAQQRIKPMIEINQRTYDEVVELLNLMERTSYIEKMEGIKLDANLLTTSGGEIRLHKEGNSINITHTEFSKMLDEHTANPNRRWYDIDSIRTELLIQNANLYDYLYRMLSGNPHIKNIYIKVNQSGASYIQVKYHKL